MGKLTPGGPDNVLGTFNTGQHFWGAESYYTGSDGVGRVVSSARRVFTWKVQTSPSPTLVQEQTFETLPSGQDPGFLTSVSSNGTQAGTAVIWAVSRPTDTNPANVLLFAFDPAASSRPNNFYPIFSAIAGTWPNTGGNANIVPVVANGQVFVASNQQLAIFGPITAGAKAATVLPVRTSQIPASGNQVSGWVDKMNGTELMLRKRNGGHVAIDARPAQDAFQSVVIWMEEAITAEGYYDPQGVLHAQTIVRAKDFVALWPPDQ